MRAHLIVVGSHGYAGLDKLRGTTAERTTGASLAPRAVVNIAGPHQLLPHPDVVRLITRLRRTGDPRCRDLLVRAHVRLVWKMAREHRWSGLERDDLVQAGLLGLLRAIDLYDPARGAVLATYARPWIRALMLRFIVENVRLVRVSDRQRQRSSFFPAAELWLDAPISAEQPETWIDLLRGEDGARPDVLVERREVRDRFAAAVRAFATSLTGRDRMLFRERWLTASPRTLAALGAKLGVTRERVRQLERRILDRLQAHLQENLGDPDTYTPALAA